MGYLVCACVCLYVMDSGDVGSGEKKKNDNEWKKKRWMLSLIFYLVVNIKYFG